MPSSDNPVEIIITDDWQGACFDALARQGVNRPLLVTSRGAAKRLGLSRIFASAPIIDDVLPQPTCEQVQTIITRSRELRFDSMIAIGGGSVLDTSKAIRMAALFEYYELEKLFGWYSAPPNNVPLFCIPTTHGTGSEVTKWATIWDRQNEIKRSLSHDRLYATGAILDVALTMSLPMDVSLITVLDALSHSFEALWSKNANETASRFALEAIKLILQNVPLLKQNQTEACVRTELLRAANLAGLAISSTQTAAAHAISYPLTLKFGIPHGLAAALPLIPLLELNRPHLSNHLQTLVKDLNLGSEAALEKQIADIPKPFLMSRLAAFGVSRDDLPEIARISCKAQRMTNAVTALTNMDVLSILQAIY